MGRSFRHYVRGFLRNWTSYRGPAWRKVGLAVRNRAIATSWIRSGCCGHRGEPGC